MLEGYPFGKNLKIKFSKKNSVENYVEFFFLLKNRLADDWMWSGRATGGAQRPKSASLGTSKIPENFQPSGRT